LDPLLVLFCVERGARFHEAVLASGAWSVSILGAGAEAAARWFATRGRPLAGQFGEVPHARGANGAPLLLQASGWLECVTHEIVTAGDHDIVVGRVVDLPEPGPASEDALVYWRSAFSRLG
jgi:flavin reductase (DIM6/NTAB) family NADH-FMN oxidoreductase RutF